MQFLKLLVGFSPWIAFLIIAQDSLFRLKVGLVVALLGSVILGLMRLNRGVILWASLAFFAYSMIAVVWLENMWTVRYMGVLANGAMMLSTWYTVAVNKPFTLEYAREHTPPALWNTPSFIRTNMIITSVWGVCFTISTLLAWYKASPHAQPAWEYDVISYAFMLLGVLFSTAYPLYVRRQRAAQAAATR